MGTFSKSYLLKIALLATGLSGIVAEYILATLATYFLGDSVLQWALIISMMLFFMGVGSRLTQYLKGDLFTYFILIEFALSVIVSFSALLTYLVASWSAYIGLLIYGTSILTGLLIGMELPLAFRLNEQFEELRINVSSILEKDYYGSLLGGLFFAFVGLPYLGLTYTPFVLGLVNFGVAVVLLNFFPAKVPPKQQKRLNLLAVGLLLFVGAGMFNAQQIVLYGEQKRYSDKVIYSEQSQYQKIVLTQWQEDYWLYLNESMQFSSFDEALYHEVLVHPAVQVAGAAREVLVMGGGDGCAVRELLKYPFIEGITLVDLDPAVTRLASEHPVLKAINEDALQDERVTVINADAMAWLENHKRFFDLLIIDFPDPRSVELSRLYSYEFYQLCRNRLRPQGVLITQAGSPYFTPSSFQCILKTVEQAGFSAIPLHNQVVTMGEWGWVLGSKREVSDGQIIQRLKAIDLEGVPTRWLNREAIDLITSFGKNYFDRSGDSLRVNRIHDPVLYRYFRQGSWELY
jgi:spermidine synthase